MMANQSRIETMNLQLFAGDEENFADWIPTAEPAAEPQAAEPTTGEPPAHVEPVAEPSVPAEPYKFKVKFNHEEQEIAEPDAIPLIQKGMNYDKLQERLNTIQADPRLGLADQVKQLAGLFGIGEEALIAELENEYYRRAADQYGTTPEQVRREHQIKQREAALNQKEQSLTQQKQKNDMYERFTAQFPDVKSEDIKPETWAKVKDGMDLTAAYVEQRNQELENRLKVLEQNAKNSKTAPVNGVTNHGSAETANQDPFLIGFESV